MREAGIKVDEYRKENKLQIQINTFVNTRIITPAWDKLVKKSLNVDLSQNQLAIDYAETRGIKLETLKNRSIGYLKAEDTNWHRDSLVFPYFLDGHVVGIRYRDGHGSKGGEKDCHFTLWHIDDLDQEKRFTVVFEGESDGLKGYEDIMSVRDDVSIVSTPTATFKLEWLREFEGYERVCIVSQADAAASKMLTAAKTALGEKFCHIELPWRRKQFGKDYCDWRSYNEAEEFLARLEVTLGNSRGKFWTGHDFSMEANQPRQYVVNNLLARGEVAMIAGPPKNKKTWFALGMAHAVVYGVPMMGIEEFAGVQGKVMIVEEEGDAESLYERAQMVFGCDGEEWKNRTLWGHHLGCRLDEEAWIVRLEKEIETFEPTLLILDPLQRMHGKDENSASEMGEVWVNLHRLIRRFPNLAVVVLHHFNKEGDISLGWNAMRGSSRNAAEADLGIFCQKTPSAEFEGSKVYIDGRNYKHIDPPTGGDVWKFILKSTGLQVVGEAPTITIGKTVGLVKEMFDCKRMNMTEMTKLLGLSPQAMSKTLAKKGMNKVIRKDSGIGKNKSVTLVWIGPQSWEDVTQLVQSGELQV